MCCDVSANYLMATNPVSFMSHSITQATEDIPVVLFLQEERPDTFITDKNSMKALNTMSLKCCLPSADATEQVFAKKGLDTFLTDLVLMFLCPKMSFYLQQEF